MAASLTEAEFSKHVGTNYQLSLDPETIDLELSEVKGYKAGADEQGGMERFSAFFEGPPSVRLPQSLYRLTHDQMGDFDIFLVPISKTERGFRYEAVFNYFKK
jgi:hypothetical protein